MRCLGCTAEMTSWTCACGGAWVGEERLVELAHDVRGTLVTLPWATRDGAGRACPTCAGPMRTVSLAGTALDRCFDHGIWFDAGELQEVLTRAQSFPAESSAPARAPTVPAPTAMRAATPQSTVPDPAPVAEETSVESDGFAVFSFLGALLEIVIDVVAD